MRLNFHRLRLESLETRSAPAVVTWDGGPTGNGTNWLDPVNWRDAKGNDILPGPDDDVSIGNTGANPTITIGASTAVRSVTSSRNIQVNGGELGIGPATSSFSSLSLNSGTLDPANGATLSNSTVTGAGTLTIPAGRTVTFLTCTLDLPLANQGTVVVTGPSNAFNGAVTNAAGATLRLSGGPTAAHLTVVGGLTNNGLVELTSAEPQGAQLTISGGAFQNSMGATVRSLAGAGGSRSITLTGTSTATNSGTIENTGANLTLNLGNGQNLSNSGVFNAGSGTTLNVLGEGSSFSINGGEFSGAGTLFLRPTVTIAVNFMSNVGELVLGSDVQVNGPGTLTNAVGKTLRVNGNVTVNTTVVNLGTLATVSHGNDFNSPVTNAAGATLRVNASSDISMNAGLTNYGTIGLIHSGSSSEARLSVSGGLTNAARAIITTQAGSQSGGFCIIFATISNQGTISAAAGSLTVVGSVSNSGMVYINDGKTLAINNGLVVGNLANTATGLLEGHGTLFASVIGAGVVSPGLSGPGRLTVNANASLGGPLAIELNGTTAGAGYDQLSVNGTVALSGSLNLTVGFTPPTSAVFTIIDNDGADSVSGTFAGLPQGTVVTAGGQRFQISYVGGTGNDVTLTYVGAAPPRVSATLVNGGATQRSRVTDLTVTFSTQVTFAGATGAAFALQRNSDGAPVAFTATEAVVGGVTVVTINGFGGSATQFGSLADGRYTLTVLATQISANGQPLDGNGDGQPGDNYTFGDAQGLFRMFGDFNGDRQVDGFDFSAFSSTFNLTSANPNFLAAFDINGDGQIDGFDFSHFSGRYNTVLP